jgi:glycosyltransferase involved in cell wall biosynthesis
MPPPLVSIVMPAHNREPYVAEAIRSVLSQTVDDWELIVVDDGSTDRTAAIVQRFCRAHRSRITLLRQANSGVVIARNRAIRMARGRFIAFLDSDDTWHRAKLACQLPVMRAFPDCAFSYTGYDIVDTAGRVQRTVRPDHRFSGDVVDLLWTENNEILGPTMMIPRDKLWAVGLFDERLRAAENFDLRVKLARLGGVYFVDQPLYRYRRHSASLTANSLAMLEQTRRVIDAHFQEPLSPHARYLKSRALANYLYSSANVHFENEQYAQALSAYVHSLALGGWRKTDIVTRALRCLIGARGNGALRGIKRHARKLAVR